MSERPTPETDSCPAEHIEVLCGQLERERDKAREDATNYYAKIGEITDNFLFLQREAFEMREAIIATLEENRHLADGDDCTLAKLKFAVPGWK